MGWMQKLCDVYDVVSRADIPEEANHPQLARVGFVKKKVNYVVMISEDGAFSSAGALGKDDCECIVPSTPQAESRTSTKGAPYPLAENLKYLAEEKGSHNALLDLYLDQLADWCAQPEAPECLRTLLAYLRRRTLLDDLRGNLPGKIKLHKDESKKDFGGQDARAVVCFGVEDRASREMRLWKRRDVQDSWSAYFARMQGGAVALCYATGEMLPTLDNHPKVQGNAKLISAKDAGYPFQYKGRFIADHSAATVSASASARAHRALQYLLENQGLSFRRFGLNIVAWNVQTGAIPVPLNEGDSAVDEDEDNVELPDTFERYSQTLCEAAKGMGRTAKVFENCIANLVDGERRASSVVIMSMEAATDGRMSIDDYQELPGGLYVDRLTDWYRSCCWTYWDKPSGKYGVRTPPPLAIADAVMGPDAVRRAKADPRCEKSDAKQLRALYRRLLSCIVDGAPLPQNFLASSVHRAEAPLTFRDSKGKWQRFDWERCVRTTCALIRRARFDALLQDARVDLGAQLPSDRLDKESKNRDYLYGRLLALADLAEYEALDRPERRALPTNAIRLMQRFAQRPKETWLHLHAKLLPYLAALGGDGRAGFFMRAIAGVESLFVREDRESATALGEDFLLGYLAQRRDFYTPRAHGLPNRCEDGRPVFPFGADRSERFGMLAAIADWVECCATLEKRGERSVCAHEGNTAALRLMVQLTQKPAATWAQIHAKLLPYLEKLGIGPSAYPIAMLCAVESGFDWQARFDNAPLNSLFLNGFYRMRACLLSGGTISQEARSAQDRPLTRDSAYASLLAIENGVERTVLDSEKREEENRTSNAVRFMNKFAASPASTWRYLEARMQPYLRKLRSAGLARSLEARTGALAGAIHENGWDSDEPLSSGWLHDYYTAAQTDSKQERSA